MSKKLNTIINKIRKLDINIINNKIIFILFFMNLLFYSFIFSNKLIN